LLVHFVEAAHGAPQLAAVRIDEGDVVKTRVAVRRRVATLACPCVQTDMVVVAARRQERRAGQAKVGAVDHHVEAQHVAVESGAPFEIGDAQVDVAHADVRVKLRLSHLDAPCVSLVFCATLAAGSGLPEGGGSSFR